MTQKKILDYAHTTALQIWAKERECLDKLPDNEFVQARERKAWEELQEIGRLVIELEQKEKT